MSKAKKIQLRTDRFPELRGIDDEVEKALQEKQKNRQYKDAGKRVHGSRKEQAMYNKLISSTDLQSIEQDEATAIELVKKDKVFPKVDPQLEKENGTDSGCAFMKVKLRQAFPATPYANTKLAREQYVKMAEAFNTVFLDAITIDDLKKLFTIATDGQIIPKTDFGMLFGKQLRNLVFVLYGYGNGVGVAKQTLIDARQYSGITKERALPHYNNLKAYYDRIIERQQQCIDSAKQIISISDMKQHRMNDLTFRGGMLSSVQTIEQYVQYVTQVCTRFINDHQKEFNQKKEQFPNKEFKPDWSWSDTKKTAAATKSSSKPKIEAVPLDYIKRTGGLLIEEADEKTVIEKLHFKSLTLGNYVKDNEAQEHIRHFVAAIVDLCEILDINLSMNENLAIAFGAFGRGGKAMATYYPTRQLINLTKRNGDGSVAHEWGHFFDHFLNGFALTKPALRSEQYLDLMMEKFGSRRKYLTSSRSSMSRDYFISEMEYNLKNFIPESPMLKSIAGLVAMLRFGYYHIEGTMVSYNQDTIKDKKPTDSFLYYYSKLQGSYWSNIAEMFARSFECYVSDKLKEQGRVNNYLVSGSMFGFPVYPQGKERECINKCFDHLIASMKSHLSIKSFTPFTTQRADEYIDLTQDGTVNKGVIVGKERKLKLAKIRAKAIIIKQKQALSEGSKK
nr:LPD1 domain-containing protein [uncultured Carboxylicivirga sp.]